MSHLVTSPWIDSVMHEVSSDFMSQNLGLWADPHAVAMGAPSNSYPYHLHTSDKENMKKEAESSPKPMTKFRF